MAIDRKSIRIEIGDLLDRHCQNCKIKTDFYRSHPNNGSVPYCSEGCSIGKKLGELGAQINKPKTKEEKRMNAAAIEAEASEEDKVESKIEKTEFKLTKEFLAAELAARKSASRVERELGMKPGTIGYYTKKWGLRSKCAPAFKGRGTKAGDAPANTGAAETATQSQIEAPTADHDPVNHPSHYTSGKVECIDAIEAATNGLTGAEAYNTGAALKYLWRWKRKNGVEDLKKARWYLDRLIGEYEGGENDVN